MSYINKFAFQLNVLAEGPYGPQQQKQRVSNSNYNNANNNGKKKDEQLSDTAKMSELSA